MVVNVLRFKYSKGDPRRNRHQQSIGGAALLASHPAGKLAVDRIVEDAVPNSDRFGARGRTEWVSRAHRSQRFC
jgi:hypothetical protein